MANLSTEQRALLLTEYQKTISDRTTGDGVWEDSTTLYVKARK